MRVLITLLMLASFPLHSEVKAGQELISLIHSFGYLAPQVAVPYCAEEMMVAEPNLLLQDDLKELGFQKIPCPDPWNDREFYRRINYRYCTTRFGEKGFTCVENEQKKINARVHNANLMKDIKSFTLKRFSDYKTSLAAQCCGDKVKCRDRFQAVELKIEPGNKAEATYVSDRVPGAASLNNRIVITEGKLASALNTENVERVLLVELAHACQFALVSESDELYEAFTHHDKRCEKASGLLMFREALGENVSQCLINELESQMNEIPENEKKNYCFGKWYREAFSDMIFRSEFKSPYHWTYDMGRRSMHKNYGSVSRYIRCAFPEDWKEKICI